MTLNPESYKNAATDAGVAAALALSGAEPKPVEPGVIYAAPDSAGGVKIIDTEKYDDAPRHTTAGRIVRDSDSFAAYLDKHGLDASEVWADSENAKVIGIIDAPEGAGRPSGWEGHKITLELRKTKSWLAWESIDAELLPQVEFADFIEEHAIDVKTPEPATLLELAQSFQANTKVDFESGQRLASGETRIEYKETTTAKAGQKGHIDIPTEIELVLRPYLDGPIYRVYARFRYRISPQGLLLGVVLTRPQDVLDGAFADIVTSLRDGRKEIDPVTDVASVVRPAIEQPIFNGRPQ